MTIGHAWLALVSVASAVEPKITAPIAYLHNAILDVQIRRAGDLVWETPTPLVKLFNRDAVKTGAKSTAVVQFFDETTLKVDENSMVIVVSARSLAGARESAMAIPSGQVMSRVDRNVDRPVEVTIRTARGWIKASSLTKDPKGSAFSTAVTPSGGVRITHESGDVTLQTEERSHRFKPRETVYLAPSGVGPAPGDRDSYVTRLPSVPEDAWKAAIPSAGPLKVRHAIRPHGAPIKTAPPVEKDAAPVQTVSSVSSVAAPASAPASASASASAPVPAASPPPAPISAPKVLDPSSRDGAPL